MDQQIKVDPSGEDSTAPETNIATPQITVSPSKDPSLDSNPIEDVPPPSGDGSASGSEGPPTTAVTTPGIDGPLKQIAPEVIDIVAQSEDSSTDDEAPCDSKASRERMQNTPLPDRKKKALKRIREFSEYLQLLEDRIERLESQQRKPGDEEKEGKSTEKEEERKSETKEEVIPAEEEEEGKPAETEGENPAETEERENPAEKEEEKSEEKQDDKKSAEGEDEKPAEKEDEDKPAEEDRLVLTPKFTSSAKSEEFNSRSLSERPRYLLEVLCWGGEAKITDEHPPDPSCLSIYQLRINSMPFGKLLEEVAKYDKHEEGLVQMARPFRLLVRNVYHIREHIGKLVAKFESPPVAQENAPEEKAEQPAGAEFAVDQIPGATDEESPKEEVHETKEALEHFRALMEFVDTYFCKTMKKYDELRSATRTKASFEDLWMVFDAGDIIFSPRRRDKVVVIAGETLKRRRKDDPETYRVVSTTGGRLLPEHYSITNQLQLTRFGIPNMFYQEYDKFSPLIIDCYNLDFDGTDYGTCAAKFQIKEYEGELAINSLEVYPLRFSAEENLQQRLTDRGLKFIQLSEVSHRFYEGLTFGENREEISSQVIVDFVLAFQSEGVDCPEFQFPTATKRDSRENHEITRAKCGVSGCRGSGCDREDAYIDHEKKRASDIASEVKVRQAWYKREEETEKTRIEQLQERMRGDAMLLPGVVPAFVLRNRKWAELDIDLVNKVDRQKNGFDDLVLPDGHKGLVKALVQTHATGSRSAAGKPRDNHEVDLVRGKGRGCVILLHGAPGVGKTSTAECVADFTERPLFPITCGDIGYDTDQVESNLEKHFTLAHKWGCVMLLDEADVFLAKRTKEDLKRNGLVSVFLRVLEYYSGILFLTTNRVGSFDDAFKSRVHLSLHYPALNRESTMKVWEMNLARTIESKKDFHIRKKEILHFARENFEALNWNGRQIRNAFQTTIALAEYKANEEGGKPVMSAEGFIAVAKASREFDLYLLKTHGHEESYRAGREGMRYDGQLNPPTVPLKMPPANLDLSSLSDSSSSSSSSEDSADEGLTREERKEKKRLKKERKKKRKAEKKEKKEKKKLAKKAE